MKSKRPAILARHGATGRSVALQRAIGVRRGLIGTRFYRQGDSRISIMHELPVTESILRIVLRHAEEARAVKVIRVSLRIGELSDVVDEWVQRYFDYLSRNTIAEGAVLRIERSPVVFRCPACAKDFPFDVKRIEDVTCPDCGGNSVEFVSGREFYVKNIEVL